MVLLLIACLGLFACTPADKPDFPSEPIRTITGWLGGSSQFLEAIANEARHTLGVPIEIVNVVGREGMDAIREFQAAPKDGYTILTINDMHFSYFAQGRIDIDPSQDWIPILIGNLAISQIYIRTDNQRYSDWDELLAYAKDHGELRVATVGTLLDMEGRLIRNLERTFGVRFQQVSYERAPERYASLLEGHTDLLIEQPGDVKEFIEAVELKPILTLWTQRVEGFESVPTARERGADFVPLLRIRGLAVSKGTPKDRIEILKAGFRAAFNSQTFQHHLKERTLDLVPYPDDPVTTIREQIEIYKKLYPGL